VSVPHRQHQHQQQNQQLCCGRSWFPLFAKEAKNGAPSFVFADAVESKSNLSRAAGGAPAPHWYCLLGVHVGAEDGVDAGLVAGVLAEPAEQVGVEADGDDFFGDRHDHLGVFPEPFVGGVGVGVGEDSAAYFGWGHAAEPRPIRAALALERRSVRL